MTRKVGLSSETARAEGTTYLVPAETYGTVMDMTEGYELAKLALERSASAD